MTKYEVISSVVAILAFSLSLYSAINTWKEKRIKPIFYLKWCHYLKGQLDIGIVISNLSSKPLTVTDICLLGNRDRCESTFFPTRLTGSMDESRISYSDSTPLNIASRSSQLFIIVFQNLDKSKEFTEQKLKKQIKLAYRVNENERFEIYNTSEKFINDDLHAIALEKKEIKIN